MDRGIVRDTMKNCRFLIVLSILTLTACTQWERPGAVNSTRDAEYAECRSRGYERFPPDMVRDVEFGFEDEYVRCEKNKKDCPAGYRYEKQPSFKTVQNDRNAAARDATIEACMYGKGWREKTYYWPQW
ncbi:Uncharacterised protein [Serratia ficaria]|nr:Uncharacterised protein [Serratia ficaria]CAI1053424.1 Uncharacterised protein [Serratia ficaria]CAI1800822.1 Uncharacterised protein [Serratia ficaria]CAI2520755.1 Uncharacterised protein [Serratia ficaria]CAI2528873.1 Uncharacterised protein [Serratia ficaria]